MTLNEAYREASKILIAGAVLGLGVLVEEALAGVLGGMPAGILTYVVSVVVGIVTGLTTACATYMLDKLDFFDVNANRRHEVVATKLNQIIDDSYENAMEVSKIFDGPFGAIGYGLFG